MGRPNPYREASEDMTLTTKCFCFILCLGLWQPALAEDEEESKSAKAADAIIANLPAGLKAGIELGKMTPAQRIDFVMTGIESKLQDEEAAAAQDAILEKMKAATEKAVRSKLYAEKIKLAYTPGQVINWADFDKELAEDVEKHMKAFGAAVTVAKVGWGAYQAFSEGDWPAALKFVGGEISSRLGEAFVPGFGYINIGAEMVEILGRFVLDYATDTAVDGLMERIFHKRSDPQGLSLWLRNKTPEEIKTEINEAFRDGAEAGMVYEGKGTVTGEASLKIRLLDAMIALRGELLAREKLQDPQGLRIKEEANKRRQDFLYAQRLVEKEAEATVNKADKALMPIREFKRRVNKLRKEDVQQVLATIETRKDAVSEGGEVPYVALNRQSLIGELHNVYSEVKETPGSGLDLAAMDRMWNAYVLRRKDELAAHHQANLDSVEAVRKSYRDPFQAKMIPLEERLKAAEKRNNDIRWSRVPGITADMRVQAAAAVDAIFAEIVALAEPYAARMEKVSKSWLENQKMMALEIAAFAQEERVVKLEAQERADRLSEQIEAAMKKISEGIRGARREHDAEINAWHQEIAATLSLPNLFRYPSSDLRVVAIETCAGICESAQRIKSGQTELIAPGRLHAERERAVIALKKITEDARKISALSEKEKAVVSRYQTTIQSLANEFEALLPKNLRAVSTDDPTDDPLSRSQAIEKYGSGHGMGESWRVVLSDGGSLRLTTESFARLDIKTFATPSIGVPVRFHRLQLQELDIIAKRRTKQFEDGRKNMQQMLDGVDAYADLDRIAVSISSLSARLDQAFQPYFQTSFTFRLKNGQPDPLGLTSESDDAKLLAKMKDAWREYQPMVMALQRQATAYGKGLKYSDAALSPDMAMASLARHESIQGKIAAAEQRMAAMDGERTTAKATVLKELKRLAADLVTLRDLNRRPLYAQTRDNLRSSFDLIFQFMQPDSPRGVFKDDYARLRQEFEDYVNQREADDKKLRQAILGRQQTPQTGVASQPAQAAQPVASPLQPSKDSSSEGAVRKFYQDFVSAYQSRNLSQLLRFLTPEWQAENGSDLRDLESTLGNSFRLFDSIQVSISGLAVRITGTGYQASYTIKLIGHIPRLSKTHEESSQVVDTLVATPEGLKIQRTSGGLNWSPK